MFGDWYYNQHVRRSVAVFGSLFDDINIVRKNAAGEVMSQIKVPLSYGPKRSFIDRITQMEDGEAYERQIAIKLPRLSFEILSMNYDAARQLPLTNKKVRVANETTSQSIYAPIPYNIQFQLNLYAKTQDDALQIVEQILPYFAPHYTVTVTPLADFPDILEDQQIRLTGLTPSDDYEGALDQRRTIIYNLDFEMKINLYKKLGAPSSIIKIADVDIFDYLDESILYQNIHIEAT